MNSYPIYQADAFTETLFGGNPAAVCFFETWPSDDILQKIAAENNLAETAFVVKEKEHYRIRWCTPTVEVKLCGHATLATAHIMFTELGYTGDTIVFDSLSGLLKVSRRKDGKITLDFPSDPPTPVTDIPVGLLEGLGVTQAKVFKSSFDYLVILPSQKDILALKQDFKVLMQVKARGTVVSSLGDEVDFVSRCFFPQSGIDEDPVTGSAHTAMIPYWVEQLGKTKMKAIQLSSRRGHLDCELLGERALISGNAVTYMKGEYYLP